MAFHDGVRFTPKLDMLLKCRLKEKPDKYTKSYITLIPPRITVSQFYITTVQWSK